MLCSHASVGILHKFVLPSQYLYAQVSVSVQSLAAQGGISVLPAPANGLGNALGEIL